MTIKVLMVLGVVCSKKNLNTAHHTRIFSHRRSRISYAKPETLHDHTKRSNKNQEKTKQKTQRLTWKRTGFGGVFKIKKSVETILKAA